MKTTLSLDVDYDPAVTDPEAVASAIEILIKTALSTPGILDDCGNPSVGEFPLADSVAGELPQYGLRLDGPLLRDQRRFLLQWLDRAASQAERDLLEGLTGLLDAIADQAHDQYGIDCLLDNGVAEAFRSAASTKIIRRYVLYDCDTNRLMGTAVYDHYADAADVACALNDVIVLPLEIESVTLG